MSSIGRGPSSVRTRVPSRTQELPPARRRSTSSGVCDPNSLACDPLGQRMTVPPGAWTRRAPGSALRMPPGPSYMEVTPSPNVGAMMAIQCGTGPGRQGGPLTCWRTYSEQAFDFPAPRPAMRSQPVHGPGGGIWWGCGCQRGARWAARRAAARAAMAARSSVVMTGLSPVVVVVVSGTGRCRCFVRWPCARVRETPLTRRRPREEARRGATQRVRASPRSGRPDVLPPPW
jgi:hypothetical protein